MISLTLAYSRAPRHVQAASPSAGTKTLVSKWPAQDPLQGATYERHQLSWSSHISWTLWRLVMTCWFWICLFVLFRGWQALASPPCPTSVSHLKLLVLFLLIWAPWEVVLDVPRSWWPANWGVFLQPFCCCRLHTRHSLQPRSDQGAPLLQVSTARAVRKGKAEDHRPFQQLPCRCPWTGSISVQTPALSVLECRALWLCTYISHTGPRKTSKAQHSSIVKSLGYWDQIPKMLLLRTATLRFCEALQLQWCTWFYAKKAPLS